MKTWQIFLIAFGLYWNGYVIAAFICARNWFKHFGPELEGVAWAMFMATVWPVIAIPYLVWITVGRKVLVK